MVKPMVLTVVPLRTSSANLPVASAGISNRENRLFLVFRAPISSTDWLWPSWRGSTTFPSGRRSATFSPVKASPPAKSPAYVTS